MPKGVYVRQPQTPKQYPPHLVSAVEHRYLKHGMSQLEIAHDLGSTLKVINRLMVHHAIPRRRQIKRNQRGDRNHMWKGDAASYAALHCRLTNRSDPPTKCQQCGTADRRLEWANLTGQYTDETDYKRLCASCHRKYDAERRRLTGRRTSPLRGGDVNAV